MKKYKTIIIFSTVGAILFLTCYFAHSIHNSNTETVPVLSPNEDYIKWVDFNISYEALNAAYNYDINTYGTETHIDWIQLLAYTAAKSGGNFNKSALSLMDRCAEQIINKEATMESLTSELKYYNYFTKAYSAVLGGLVGEYETQKYDENGTEKIWEKTYGLKGYSPIAQGFYYNDYDDFGVSRTYGYKRRHLGHDMMGSIGTPIIAVESGYVEAIGWNQYGGWRLGVRSFDKQRYYYYAHLRKDAPYNENLKIGSIVKAGDVIGYLGRTGYSRTENVNNIDSAHLHFGIQLIFNESQKEGNNEIWIDCYDLIKFLYKHRSKTERIGDSKESTRVYDIKDPAVDEYEDIINRRHHKLYYKFWNSNKNT